jgi:RNA polymerase sigma-70 factor (ECF subfamily)
MKERMAAAAKSPDPAVERPALHVVRDSDGELLGRIAERDPLAFEALYRRYARPVFGLALRQLGDRGRAADAVQDAFTAVWRSAAHYRPKRGPGAPWLYAIARNAIVDSIRASARSRHGSVDDLPELVSSELAPDESAEEAWVAFRIHVAVAALPERERVLLELAYWHGRSQSEIAHLLGLPLGTVKTRTRSGLAHLAAHLEGKV